MEEKFTWLRLDKEYNLNDKRWSRRYYIALMLNRTKSMFEYKNLPDTVDAFELENFLQMNGICCIGKCNNKLYAFEGGYGGKPDAYYHPKEFIVANPYLNFNHTFKLDVDAVLMRNDPLRMGLLPMFNRYAQILLECDISLLQLLITSRAQKIITAGDNNTKVAADKFINDLAFGKFSAILDSDLIKGLSVQDFHSANSNVIQNVIELMQYVKGSFYNDIGLQANFNMKRSAISNDEAQLNDDALLPLVDIMLKTRKDDIEKINKLFNTNISVDFSSAWEIRKKLLDKAVNSNYNTYGDTINTELKTQKTVRGD